MGLFKKYISQTRKPEGVLGKLMVSGMNNGHTKLADWGMSHLNGITASNIAELGCGGGRNAGELMNRYPAATLTALDYAEASIAKAKRYNKDMISAGRCSVIQGSVAELPLESDAFDLATAFETVYFWPGLENCFKEVCRILQHGGVFIICNESDGTDEAGLKFEKMIDGMKCYTEAQLAAALKTAGFAEVRTDHHPNKPWITAMAKK